MACEFDNPDCLHCPYDDCTATSQDIIRQWKLTNGLRRMDDPDCIPKRIKSVEPKRIGVTYSDKQQKYFRTEKGKEALRRYYGSDKGKATLKRYEQTEKGKERHKRYAQSEKGKATKRRYYLKKKLERESAIAVRIEVS